MAHVYILLSASTGRFYVGATVDLARRLSEHARGHSPYTRGRGPWQIVFQEEFPSLAEARQREREIKNWKSHQAIKALIATNPSG
jgi:predicted GIY-YIG superfamily endonuclease